MKFKFAIIVISISACFFLISCMAGHKPTGINANPYLEEFQAEPTEVPIQVLLVIPDDAALSLLYEKQGDRAFIRLAKTTDFSRALELASSAVGFYKKAVVLNKSRESLVHKYCMAIELKYNVLIPDKERKIEKKNVYADTLAMLEKLYPGETNSIYANYDLTLLLILNAQYSIIFEVIGAVNRIYGLCGKICIENRSFEDYNAAAALGRINYLAPNIPVLIPWPDKKMSRKYLEEVLTSRPDAILVKYFLADTLYALGEKKKASVYFNEVNNAVPRCDMRYFSDVKTRRNCAIRMEKLGIKLSGLPIFVSK